jgi:hypothetical protein
VPGIRAGLRLVDTILHPITLALNAYGLRVVEKTIEDRGGQSGIIVEDLGPMLVRLIGGDDGRPPLVALAEDLKEQVSAGFVDGQIAEFIDLC